MFLSCLTSSPIPLHNFTGQSPNLKYSFDIRTVKEMESKIVVWKLLIKDNLTDPGGDKRISNRLYRNMGSSKGA